MIREIIQTELQLVLRNAGVVLVVVFAPIIYSTLYSLGYAKQVVREVPIAVIDHSATESSRGLIEELDATPYIAVTKRITDIIEGRKALFSGSVFGVLYIPTDYEKQLIIGYQSPIAIYCDGSHFLFYKEFLEGVAAVIAPNTAVTLKTTNLFNPDLGYASFIMPAVLLIILQQTALMGIAITGAIWHKRGLWQRWSAVRILTAKSIVFGSIYALLFSAIFTIDYRIFGYPQLGAWSVCAAVLIPYILSVIMLGIALSTLFCRAESPLLAIIWTSIPVLLVSGASLPVEAFPKALSVIGELLPSSSAVKGFVLAQSAGATLAEVAPYIVRLWGLTLLYCVLSLLSIHKKQDVRKNYQTSNTPDLLP